MKKISQIILYTVLGVVVLGLILTSVLKKDFAPNIAVPTHTSKGIEIRSANVAQYDGLSNEEKYNEFVDIYSDSYKLTILYSVFSGEISRKQEISNYGKKAPDIKNGYIETKGLFMLILGGVTFSAVGACLALVLPTNVLKLCFGVFLCLLAIMEIFKGFRDKK